jgi:hypothetical protein
VDAPSLIVVRPVGRAQAAIRHVPAVRREAIPRAPAAAVVVAATRLVALRAHADPCIPLGPGLRPAALVAAQAVRPVLVDAPASVRVPAAAALVPAPAWAELRALYRLPVRHPAPRVPAVPVVAVGSSTPRAKKAR